MRVKFCCLIMALLLGYWTCTTPSPPNRKILNYPHYTQIVFNYCAATCIEMWARGVYSQGEIGSYINVGPTGAMPDNVVLGVRYFTGSTGYLAALPTARATQGDLIAACQEGVQNYATPAIMPFYNGTHAVLTVGFEWDKDYGVAEFAFIHDPDPYFGGPRIAFSIADLIDFYFTDVGGDSYVILGEEYFFDRGEFNHDTFVLNGGTYYGGPSHYDPKGLTGPSTN